MEKNSCMKVEARQVQIMKRSPAIRANNHDKLQREKKEWIVCLLLIKKER